MAKAVAKNNAQAVNADIYASGDFKPVVEKCEGCDRVTRVDSGSFCRTYVDPEAKWKFGLCNFATHVKPEITIAKVKINPLKASKRASAKMKK